MMQKRAGVGRKVAPGDSRRASRAEALSTGGSREGQGDDGACAGGWPEVAAAPCARIKDKAPAPGVGRFASRKAGSSARPVAKEPRNAVLASLASAHAQAQAAGRRAEGFPP